MLKILKAIYNILSNNPDITNIVGDKIFPDIVPDLDNTNDNIDYPLIIMKRTDYKPEYTKGCKILEVEVEINCYSNSYFEVIDLAQYVIDSLELYKGEVEGIKINKSTIINISEEYNNDAYYQGIKFNIK